MPACRLWLRLVLFVAVSAVLYYVAGGAYYCFATCCAIHEARAERRRLSGVLFLLAAVAVKFALDSVLVQIDLASHNFHVFSLEKPQNGVESWRIMVLYLYFPACALFVVFRRSVSALTGAAWQRFRNPLKKPPLPEHGGSSSESRKQISRSGVGLAPTRIIACMRWAGGSLFALLLAATAGFCCLERQRKVLLEIEYCTVHGLWDEALAKAKTLPPAAYSRFVNHDVNLALYHAGRLPYEMLSYPQTYSSLLSMNDVRDNTALLRRPLDLLLEVGRVNEAEHLSLEALESHPSGGVLKRLALVKLAKGQLAAAGVVLKVLRDDLIWGHWAEEHLQRLAADPRLTDDDEVQRIRGLMISKDDMHLFSVLLPNRGVFFNSKICLFDLLKHNGENQMAFEYLMAICLCDRDLDAVAQLLPFLDGLPYSATPPLYEEAALLYSRAHPEQIREVGSEVFFRGRQISESTMKKFRRLQEIATQCGGAKKKMESNLARELGDTYFYYYYFHTSGRRS